MPLTSGYAEMTNYEGRPVQLFDFNRGTIHWRYARADQDIMFRGELYEALPGIKDGGVQQNAAAGDNDVAITEGPHDWGRRLTCFLRDPDGNVLEFNELVEQ